VPFHRLWFPCYESGEIEDACDFVSCTYYSLGEPPIIEPLVLAVVGLSLKSVVHVETVYIKAIPVHKANVFI